MRSGDYGLFLGDAINKLLSGNQDLSVAQIMQVVGIQSRSLMTEYMTGRKRPRPQQAGWLAAMCKVPPLQLAEALHYDKNNSATEELIAAYYFYLSGGGLLTDFLDAHFVAINDANRLCGAGLLDDAMKSVEKSLLKLDQRKAAERDKPLRKKIDDVYLKGLLARIEFTTLSSVREIVVDAIEPDIMRAGRIVIELRDKERGDLVAARLVDAKYMEKRFKEALPEANWIAATHSTPAPLFIVNRVRIRILGRQNNREDFEHVEKAARRAMDKDRDSKFWTSSNRAAILQAIALSRSDLGLSGAVNVLHEASLEFNDEEPNERRVLRNLQANIAELEIIAKPTFPDKDRANELFVRIEENMPPEGISNYVPRVNKAAEKAGIPRRLATRRVIDK